MSGATLLEDLTRHGVKMWTEGGELRCRGPRKTLTPEVLAQLKKHKPFILRALTRREERRHDTSPPITSVGEVQDMARSRFPPVEDPVAPPAPPGRDRLVHHGTEKGRFYKGDWRATWPLDFEVHRGEGP